MSSLQRLILGVFPDGSAGTQIKLPEIPFRGRLRETLRPRGYTMDRISFGWKEPEPLAGELPSPSHDFRLSSHCTGDRSTSLYGGLIRPDYSYI
jgi:hypothetical protein